jgi:hypothetical protein
MNLLNCRGNLWLEQLGDPIDRSEMGNFQITSRRPRVRKKLLRRRVAWGEKRKLAVPSHRRTEDFPRETYLPERPGLEWTNRSDHNGHIRRI